MKNIALVGFMGTGKTAVAQRVAAKLNMRYVDLDDVIEEREGRPIKEIFANEGEAHFRKVEKDVTRDISRDKGIVIATGGGVVLDDENMQNLKENGVVICLTASPAVILQRTAHNKQRPLLNVDDPEAKIKELLASRAPFYHKADYAIDTSPFTLDEVVERVVRVAKKKY